MSITVVSASNGTMLRNTPNIRARAATARRVPHARSGWDLEK
jgi:hypothetical protein